jgi:hypothetical protein
MISLEMNYAPEDSDGYLSYWITDERVSITSPVYTARSTKPFPENRWAHLVIIHERTEGVVLYLDGQNVVVAHDNPPVFPPNVYRDALNFNSGRGMQGSPKYGFNRVDDRIGFSISNVFIWNRYVVFYVCICSYIYVMCIYAGLYACLCMSVVCMYTGLYAFFLWKTSMKVYTCV